jgi:hypothetical protein
VVRRIRNATAANLAQDVAGLPFLARALSENSAVLRLSAEMLAKHAPSRFDLVMNARSVLRRIGMYDLSRSRAAGRVVLLDEGPVLIAYHLFVYSSADLDTAPLEQFAASVPLPDRVIYVRSPLPVLAARALSRPDRRRQLAGLTAADAEQPLLRAQQVFDRLVSTPYLRDRTLVVENASQDPRELDELAAQVASTVRSWTAGAPPEDRLDGPAVAL